MHHTFYNSSPPPRLEEEIPSFHNFLKFLLPLLSYLNLPNVVIISVLTPPSLRKQPQFF